MARTGSLAGRKRDSSKDRQTLLSAYTFADVEPLNRYGDRKIVRTVAKTQCGCEIASQRLDDLDIECQQFALDSIKEKRQPLVAVDLGSGSGIQTLRLGLLGFRTIAYDLLPESHALEAARAEYPIFQVETKVANLRDASGVDFPSPLLIAYSQRFLHYLRYEETRTLLSNLYSAMERDGRLFISASGLTSEIGQLHPDRNLPVHERFATLPKSVARHHKILEPICPWSERELVDVCVDIGFTCVTSSCSEFGNVRGIFSK